MAVLLLVADLVVLNVKKRKISRPSVDFDNSDWLGDKPALCSKRGTKYGNTSSADYEG